MRYGYENAVLTIGTRYGYESAGDVATTEKRRAPIQAPFSGNAVVGQRRLKQLAAPAELVAQHVEVAVVEGMHQMKLVVALLDQDLVPRVDR